MFKLYKVNLQLSIAYHPQTDGQIDQKSKSMFGDVLEMVYARLSPSLEIMVVTS